MDVITCAALNLREKPGNVMNQGSDMESVSEYDELFVYGIGMEDNKA